MKIGAIQFSFLESSYQTERGGNFEELAERLEVPLIGKVKFPLSNLSNNYDNYDSFWQELEQLGRDKGKGRDRDRGYDALVIGWSDSEFYLTPDNQQLLTSYRQATFTPDIAWGVDYPLGTTVEIISTRSLGKWKELVESDDYLVRNFFSNLTAKKLDDFIITNNYLLPTPNPMVDLLNGLRISLFSDSQQNKQIIERIKKKLSDNKINDQLTGVGLAEIITSDRNYRTYPKIYELYLNDPDQPGNILSIIELGKILKKIKEFTPESILLLPSGVGHKSRCLEATDHPNWLDLLDIAQGLGLEIILETSAVNWSQEISDHLIKKSYSSLKIVFRFEAIDESYYQHLRGEGFASTLENIEYFLLRYPRKKNCFVKTIKTEKSYDLMLGWREHFSTFTSNLIIAEPPISFMKKSEKYNYNTPSVPIDCWQLKRKMSINHCGEAVVCPKSIGEYDKKLVLGSLVEEEIAELYERGNFYFEQHLNGWDYCRDCPLFYQFEF